MRILTAFNSLCSYLCRDLRAVGRARAALYAAAVISTALSPFAAFSQFSPGGRGAATVFAENIVPRR